MSRGTLYFISKDIKESPVMCANTFWDTPDASSLGTFYSDDYGEYTIELLSERGLCIEKVNDDFYKIRVSKEKRENYFSKSFISFKKEVEKLTLSEFASQSMDALKSLTTDPYTDCVYTEEEAAYDFDDWYRTAEEDTDYYVAVHTLIMH